MIKREWLDGRIVVYNRKVNDSIAYAMGYYKTDNGKWELVKKY